MSLRFTNTDKWSDTWFSNLSQLQMLLFIYLCENCDIAGFIETNYKRWASDLNSSIETIKGACEGLQRGLLFSENRDCIFIKNFLKHQKNYPLNPKNNCHKKITECFDKYSQVFGIKDIDEFIQGASKGLISPIGNGNGNGNGNIITWKENFEIYKNDLRKSYNELLADKNYIEERERYHPGLDIKKTIEKACVDFWATEAGWKNKKSSRSKEIDWKITFNNSLSQKLNQVWKEREDRV